MVRSKFLRVVLALVFVSFLTSEVDIASASMGSCTVAQAKFGTCAVQADVDGDHVTIGAFKHHKKHGTPAFNPLLPITLLPAAPVHVFQIGSTDPFFGCSVMRPCEIGVVDPTKPGTGGLVTITDLKNFPPHPGIDHMQPNGWAIIGLDTNFYATIGSETEHGKLLGRQADVRFAPVGFNWVYGDGKSATSTTPGASWASQGIDDFDPTDTSHVFEHKGNYTIHLDVIFSAEYRYAGGAWAGVIGTIAVPSVPLKITAGDAKTVLVNRDCTQNPAGPGC
jgi:hypothetical protein